MSVILVNPRSAPIAFIDDVLSNILATKDDSGKYLPRR